MNFSRPLISARLLRRYKRFLADVVLEDGREVTAHCANPGAMLGLNTPGMQVWLEPNDDPKRKLNYSWKLTELPGGHLVGIDTSLPNRIVAEALAERKISALARYDSIRPEVRYGAASRVDFLLGGAGLPDVYLEVKNVHLSRTAGLAEFPDCVTLRGAKHLHELANMVAAGHRAIMLYLVQRTDCSRFALARDCDPGYARAFDVAVSAGVEVLCYDAAISRAGISLDAPLPVDILA